MSHETMSERVRNIGDGLILAFPVDEAEVSGQTINTMRLYFFRVAEKTRYYQEYTSLSSIAGNSTTPSSGYGYLGDSGVDSGSDIFRVESDDWRVMHYGVGTNHPDLRVFNAVDPKANGNPAQSRTGSGEDITPGSDARGFYTGKQIADRYDPDSFTERVAFRNSSNNTGQFLLWAFENPTSSQLAGNDLTLYFTGGGYTLQPVVDPDVQETMLRMSQTRPDEPAIDTIMHVVGGITNYNLGSQEPDSWKDVREKTPGLTQEFNAAKIGSQGDSDKTVSVTA